MNSRLLGLGALLLFTQSIFAQTAPIPPTACITPEFSVSGDPYWKSITLKLKNNCNALVDFENTIVTFKNKAALNTTFWGDFAPLPYPDNNLNITSQQQADGTFLANITMHFTAYTGSSTKLPAGGSIQIKYGANADTHIDGSTNVYVGAPVGTGSISVKNASTKPSGVTQTYALVHLSLNGQKIKDIQLPWGTTSNVANLAPGTYSITADSITAGSSTYQATAVPSSVAVTTNQQSSSTITYGLLQQTGKITISLQALPNELAGYTNKPTVSITDSQSGASVSKVLSWNTSTVVSQLKAGSIYKFATAPISYSSYNCAPTFAPTQLAASTTAPLTKLTYKCIQVAQDQVNVNVTGAPAALAALKITLTPNNNTAPVSTTVNLANGSGSTSVTLYDGVIYTLASDPVSGYSIKFNPQPLTAAASASVNITLSQQNLGTPIAANGQLTVCGTKLCNAQGNPIQLKGMSTHGLQWYGESVCMKPEAMNALASQFKSNVVRIALYVQEGGYETNPAQFTQQVTSLINQATSRGMYVIVDWHILNPGDPNSNLTLAKKFFTDIATAHKDKNNIIYEIANEPNGVSWAAIRNYATQIIPVIRAIDPKAPIIVGTRGWSSLGVSDGSTYQEIVNNPVPYSNIMYAFHFYAASHRDNYLDALDKASNVLPIFVTEFGTQTYSGDGGNDFVMSDKYMQLMANKKIGWTNWNFSDDWRSGAIWNTGTCSQNVWSDDRLKPSGVYIKKNILMP